MLLDIIHCRHRRLHHHHRREDIQKQKRKNLVHRFIGFVETVCQLEICFSRNDVFDCSWARSLITMKKVPLLVRLRSKPAPCYPRTSQPAFGSYDGLNVQYKPTVFKFCGALWNSSESHGKGRTSFSWTAPIFSLATSFHNQLSRDYSISYVGWSVISAVSIVPFFDCTSHTQRFVCLLLVKIIIVYQGQEG
jgi:hypothetical protein